MSDLKPTDLCPVMDMEVQGCEHCRRTGRYKPPEGSLSKTMKLDPGLTLSMDADGDLWIGPDEAFRRIGRD